MKLTAALIRHGASRLKSALQGGYNHAYKLAGQVDNAVSVGKRLYGVLAPLLDQYTDTRPGVLKALQNYEGVRQKVVDVHERGQQVGRDVRRIVPELRL